MDLSGAQRTGVCPTAPAQKLAFTRIGLAWIRLASCKLASGMQGHRLKLRIFLVEDSEIIRANLSETLVELGDAQVVAYARGEADARGWLAAHPRQWDLAVIDLFLKEGSGLGVLAAQPKSEPSQRMIVLSNYATREMRSRCIALGADAVFDKSTELDDLMNYCLRLHDGP